MKFACEQCGRKYVLADDKIAAKEDVRLKCRQCGQIVVVKQAGEMVAKSLATPVPRLPVPEGAVPPPAMPPPFKRPSSRALPVQASTDEPEGADASLPARASAPEQAEGTDADLADASETLHPSAADRRSSVDAHSETVPETMRASGIGLPRLSRPSLPRLGAKRPNLAPPQPAAAQLPAQRLPELAPKPGPEPEREPVQDGGNDRPAEFEPSVSAATAEKMQLAPAAGGTERASDTKSSGRLWLGASSTQEKRRMLIALGVGFVLGTLFGLVF